MTYSGEFCVCFLERLNLRGILVILRNIRTDARNQRSFTSFYYIFSMFFLQYY